MTAAEGSFPQFDIKYVSHWCSICCSVGQAKADFSASVIELFVVICFIQGDNLDISVPPFSSHHHQQH